jgi:uncharacterized membrane protein
MRPPPHPSAGAMTVVVRIGTTLSTTLLAIGLVLALAGPNSGAARLPLTAGLVILMVTPVTNLLVAVVDEIAAREWAFVAFGAVVLLLLGGSLFVAFS